MRRAFALLDHRFLSRLGNLATLFKLASVALLLAVAVILALVKLLTDAGWVPLLFLGFALVASGVFGLAKLAQRRGATAGVAGRTSRVPTGRVESEPHGDEDRAKQSDQGEEDLPDWLSGREAEVRRLQGTLTKQLAEPYFDVRQVERTADTFQRVNNDVAHKLRLEASEEAAAQFEANPDWFDPVPTRLRPQEFQEVARLMGYAADQIARARVQINRAKQTGAAGALALRVRDEARQGWQLRDRVLADPMTRTDMSLRYDCEIETWIKRVVDLLAGAGEESSAHEFLARVPSPLWLALGIQGNQRDSA